MIPKIDNNYKFPQWVKFLSVDIKNNIPVILTGHKGCGKTTALLQLAARANSGKGREVIRLNLNGQLTMRDFLGYTRVVAGETKWVNGGLLDAYENGKWLLLDEADYGESSILCVLNQIMEDGNSNFFVKETAQNIMRHPDFRLFLTGNTFGKMAKFKHLYQGSQPINDALIDRTHVYYVDYLPAKEEADMIVDRFAPKMNIDMAIKFVAVANDIRAAFASSKMRSTFSTRNLIAFLNAGISYKDNVDFLSAIKDTDKKSVEVMKWAWNITYASKISDQDAATAAEVFQRHLGVKLT